jgi:hypothetical protein
MSNNKLKFLLFITIIFITNIQSNDYDYNYDYPESYEPDYYYEPSTLFELQFSALFLKPSSSNLYYGIETLFLPILSPNWNILDIDPKYRFGFDLGFRTLFNELDTNLAVNWIRFHSSHTNSTQASSTNFVGPFLEVGPTSSFYKQATGNVKFHFDEVNVNYGQLVSFGELDTNFFVGVGFVQIKQKLSTLFTSTNGNFTRTITDPSSFIGGGPQVGLDFCYCIIDDLYLTGNALITLFSGKLKNQTTFSSTGTNFATFTVPSPNVQTITVNNRFQLIPALEEKIGLAYERTFCDHYSFTIEVGYQAKIYFNAVQSTDMSSQVTALPPPDDPTIGVFARTFQRTLGNFSLSGPYIAVSFGF